MTESLFFILADTDNHRYSQLIFVLAKTNTEKCPIKKQVKEHGLIFLLIVYGYDGLSLRARKAKSSDLLS